MQSSSQHYPGQRLSLFEKICRKPSSRLSSSKSAASSRSSSISDPRHFEKHAPPPTSSPTSHAYLTSSSFNPSSHSSLASAIARAATPATTTSNGRHGHRSASLSRASTAPPGGKRHSIGDLRPIDPNYDRNGRGGLHSPPVDPYSVRSGSFASGSSVHSGVSAMTFDEEDPDNTFEKRGTSALERGKYLIAETLLSKALANLPPLVVNTDDNLDDDGGGPPSGGGSSGGRDSMWMMNGNSPTDRRGSGGSSVVHARLALKLSKALYMQDKIEEAQAALMECEAHIPPNDRELSIESALHAIDVWITARDLEEADRRCWQAMREARKCGRTHPLYHRAIAANIRVLRLRGQNEEAEAYVSLVNMSLLPFSDAAHTFDALTLQQNVAKNSAPTPPATMASAYNQNFSQSALDRQSTGPNHTRTPSSTSQPGGHYQQNQNHVEPSDADLDDFWQAFSSKDLNRLSRAVNRCPAVLETTKEHPQRNRISSSSSTLSSPSHHHSHGFHSHRASSMTTTTTAPTSFHSDYSLQQQREPASMLATPLHVAVDEGLVEVARLLVAQGADVNNRDPDGWRTPLHKAAAAKRSTGFLCRLLLDAGAAVNASTAAGETPLHIAVAAASGSSKGMKLVDLLLSRGASVDAVDNKGHTPLYVSCYYGRHEIATRLIAAGADVNGGLAETDAGFTPLHRAAIEGFADVAKLLLENGARVNAKDTKGRTPLMYAVNLGSTRWTKVEKLLRKNGGVVIL